MIARNIVYIAETSVLQVDELPIIGDPHSCDTETLDSSTSSFEPNTSEVYCSSVTAPSLSPFTSEFDITEDEGGTFRPSLARSSLPSAQSRQGRRKQF